MNLTKPQTDALLQLGESAAGHDFINAHVLEQLLALQLIYWRKPDEVDFTSIGEEVYDELTGQAV